MDHNNVTGTQLSPRAALIWQASPVTTFKALYGRANRPPNVYERDYDDGVAQVANPGLAGENIDSLELVVDHRMVHDLNLRGSIYQWTIDDLVALGIDPISGLPQYQTGGDARASGAELSADKTWDSGARLRASVSYQDVANADGGDLLNSPNWLGKLNFSTPLPWLGLRLGYALQYDGRRLSKDGSSLDSYWLSNLNLIADKWAKGMELSLGIRTDEPRLTVLETDLLSLSDEQVKEQVDGCDVVISCLGHTISAQGVFGKPRDLVTRSVERAYRAIRERNAEATGVPGRDPEKTGEEGKQE